MCKCEFVENYIICNLIKMLGNMQTILEKLKDNIIYKNW